MKRRARLFAIPAILTLLFGVLLPMAADGGPVGFWTYHEEGQVATPAWHLRNLLAGGLVGSWLVAAVIVVVGPD